jgi:two-component system sensor histidine kinase YesM
MEMPIIKLSLQPVVENAILHGFAGYRNDGSISIRAIRSSACICISVTDNGIGLMPEEIQSIHNALRQYPPPPNMPFFGLYNINWRIRRTYGKKYGLSLDSAVSEYTTVTLTLPLP